MSITKGQRVYDRITGKPATVTHVEAAHVDGEPATFYRIAGVPFTPDYPEAEEAPGETWRHDGEVEE